MRFYIFKVFLSNLYFSIDIYTVSSNATNLMSDVGLSKLTLIFRVLFKITEPTFLSVATVSIFEKKRLTLTAKVSLI